MVCQYLGIAHIRIWFKCNLLHNDKALYICTCGTLIWWGHGTCCWQVCPVRSPLTLKKFISPIYLARQLRASSDGLPNTWPAWYAALLVCCNKAAWVGGMLSSTLAPCERSCFLASFTLLWSDLLLYSKTTNPSFYPVFVWCCAYTQINLMSSSTTVSKQLPHNSVQKQYYS